MRNVKWPFAALAGLALALGGAATSAVAAPAGAVQDHQLGHVVNYVDFGRGHGGHGGHGGGDGGDWGGWGRDGGGDGGWGW
ncbi:hypothetical protein SAMN06272765_7606 [Streptomyces sp. Ag109_G2-15]|nr:hypothetical protein SAMN06272765_7606 [Streptomyces sp. Ag109_G2-15]